MRRALRWLGRLQMAAGLAVLAAGIVLVAGFDRANAPTVVGPEDSAPAAVLPGLPAIFPDEATTRPSPAATNAPAASTAPIRSLQIPRIAVDAPVVTVGVDSDGVMQAPYTPTDVGWYDFSVRPGNSGNAVFAAHVDYVNYGAAVFFRLNELQSGDAILVTLEDGSRFAYEVVSSVLYDLATAPVQEIVGPTERETITLITCAGAFDQEVLQYDKRLVVRAERLARSS